MGEITIRKLDEATLAALDRRAASNGRTELVEQLRRERDALAAKYGVFSDSTPLIREWRDK